MIPVVRGLSRRFARQRPARRCGWVAAFVSALILVSGSASAVTTDTVAIKREILALYDGGQEGSADGSRIHRFAELPLNHLGFIVRFHDVRVEMPDPASMERYRGVLTWFVGPIPNSRRYLAMSMGNEEVETVEKIFPPDYFAPENVAKQLVK